MKQKEFSDLIRGLKLSKNKAELLSSEFKEWNLRDYSVNVTKFRSRQKYFEHFFITQSEFSTRNNVKG